MKHARNAELTSKAVEAGTCIARPKCTALYLVADCLVLLKHVGHNHQLGAQLLGMAALKSEGRAESRGKEGRS